MYWSKRPPGRVVDGLRNSTWNQKACTASRKERAGFSGTARQIAAICSSSAFLCGRVSFAAISSASAA